MAISLGFGVLFATVITLALVPSIYLIVEDLKQIVRKLRPSRQPTNTAVSGPGADQKH